MQEEKKAFEYWAIVELMGRNMIAGFASEETIAGVSMLRVDVPATEHQPEFTKFFGGSSIYAITPTTQEIATVAANKLQNRPVSEWTVPTRMIEQGRNIDSYGYEDEGDFRDEL